MKRVMFTLLYDSGSFMLSRNFRLQRIGDLDWLLRNYQLMVVSEGLDELMILNVSPVPEIDDRFLGDVRAISRECFIPVTVGGGVGSTSDAQRLLEVGVDKVLMNSSFHDHPSLCESIAESFGRQFLVQGIDFVGAAQSSRPEVRLKGGRAAPVGIEATVERGREVGAGEVLFQSVDRDGTGMGLDLSVLDGMREQLRAPVILMGGVGRVEHIREGLLDPDVDAVATANLLNFVGDAFLMARAALLEAGVDIPHHSGTRLAGLRGIVDR